MVILFIKFIYLRKFFGIVNIKTNIISTFLGYISIHEVGCLMNQNFYNYMILKLIEKFYPYMEWMRYILSREIIFSEFIKDLFKSFTTV